MGEANRNGAAPRRRRYRGRHHSAPSCDCGLDTMDADEFYMVKDEIWNAAWPGCHHGCMTEFLCIGCIEQRLGRRLAPDDFEDVPINKLNCMSPRLRDRLARRLSVVRDFETLSGAN